MTSEVSIIMSEFNTPRQTLMRAISSILNQTYTNFEFIIINDGSDTPLQEIADSFQDDRIKVYNNAGNKGLVYSLNRAVELTKNELLIRMDTDDIARPDRVEKLVKFMVENPMYSVAGSRAIQFSERGYEGILGKAGEKTVAHLLKADLPIHPSVIMLKSHVLEVGKYPNIRRAEDFGLWAELLAHGRRIFVLNDVLLEYQVLSTDYAKRSIQHRKEEIRAKFHYFRKFKAKPWDYLYFLRPIISGILPHSLLRKLRSLTVLKNQ